MGLLEGLKRLLGAEPERPVHVRRAVDPDLEDARRRIERLDARLEVIKRQRQRQEREQ